MAAHEHDCQVKRQAGQQKRGAFHPCPVLRNGADRVDVPVYGLGNARLEWGPGPGVFQVNTRVGDGSGGTYPVWGSYAERFGSIESNERSDG